MESTDTEAIDLRHILDDPRWRAGASEELMRTPLARRLANWAYEKNHVEAVNARHEVGPPEKATTHNNLVVLNDWIARKTRRDF